MTKINERRVLPMSMSFIIWTHHKCIVTADCGTIGIQQVEKNKKLNT